MTTRENEAKALIAKHGSQKVKEALIEVLTIHPLPTGLHVYDEQLRANESDDSWVGECNKTAWGYACAKELAHRYNCHNELIEALKGFCTRWTEDEFEQSQIPQNVKDTRALISRATNQ